MFLLVTTVSFPGLLIGLMLGMEHVERRLTRGLLVDQVDWMLRSELAADAVELQVADRLVASLAGKADGRTA